MMQIERWVNNIEEPLIQREAEHDWSDELDMLSNHFKMKQTLHACAESKLTCTSRPPITHNVAAGKIHLGSQSQLLQ